jgi:hypothetical protein
VWVLETDRSELFDDPDAYSDTVLSELKHEGYSQEQIMQLFTVCIEKLSAEAASQAEVAATADFLPAGEVPLASSPSTTV